MDKFDVMDVNEKQREHIDALNAHIKALRSQTLYVVEMLRWGDRECHSYVIGVFDNERDAKQCGEIEKSWRGGKYEYEVKSIVLNDWDDRDGEKYENHEQTRPRSFTYSTNWMGPVSTQWYRDRGLLKNVWKTVETEAVANLRRMDIGEKYLIEETTEQYACGRIDIRGDTESPFGDEYGVAPMRMEDWNAFGDWLEGLDTTYQWSYDHLLEVFERDTGITIRWAK